MALTRYGRSIGSAFDLLGRNEVNLTAALGWTLTASPRLLAWMWDRWDLPGQVSAVDVSLEVADDSGRTDLQLSNSAATVVVEAKRGWLLPEETQLTQYVPRLAEAPHPLLVSLSDSSHRWAKARLVEVVGPVPVVHLAWDDVRAALRTLQSAGVPRVSSAERVWLDQLATYLAGVRTVRDPAEQWVYVVAVNQKAPGGSGPHSYRDYVVNRRYFHPLAPQWPKRPPVLIGFRWDSMVRQVNRVVRDRMVETLQEEWPEIPVNDDTSRPHVIYELGPDLPLPDITTSSVRQARRVWALLDQMLTTRDLAEAERASRILAEPGLSPPAPLSDQP